MIPQKKITKDLETNTNLGADELPALYINGVYTTKYKLTLKERIKVFLFGNIFLNLISSEAHPPVRIDVEAPYQVLKVNYIPWGMEGIENEETPSQEDESIPEEEDKPEFEDEQEEKKRKADDRGFFS